MQLYWDEFLRHFRLCDKEDSGLSLTKNKNGKDPQNRPKHTRKRIHQAKKTFEIFQNNFLLPYKDYFFTQSWKLRNRFL
ncbi:hypothetical protein B5F71_14165 [Bacteroides sp. An269]|nr:hypothetical protein B5F71_14165 [Bacteroides sp. An269]